MAAHYAWVLIVSGVSSVIILLFWWFMPKGQRIGFALVILGIVALGSTVGLHGGLSRVGAVGQIMAAILGLLGGLVLWLFSVNRDDGPVASIVVLALSASVFLAYREGSRLRVGIETYEYWRTECTAAYMQNDITAKSNQFWMIDSLFGEMCGQIFKSEKELLIGKRPSPIVPRYDLF